MLRSVSDEIGYEYFTQVSFPGYTVSRIQSQRSPGCPSISTVTTLLIMRYEMAYICTIPGTGYAYSATVRVSSRENCSPWVSGVGLLYSCYLPGYRMPAASVENSTRKSAVSTGKSAALFTFYSYYRYFYPYYMVRVMVLGKEKRISLTCHIHHRHHILVAQVSHHHQ